jgi:TPR repeat protein
MKLTLKHAVAAIFLILNFGEPVAADPFEDAKVAYVRGDYATALRLWRSLADQGDASAQSNLGLMYSEGRGAPQDYTEAMKWYRRAADQGLSRAQSNLGRMYSKGNGVPQDYIKAVNWYRLAADQGLPTAQFNLGKMYRKGNGVPQDYVLAHMWLNLSTAQGYQDAITNRDIVARHMTPAQIAEAQKLAREWKPTK